MEFFNFVMNVTCLTIVPLVGFMAVIRIFK